MFGGIEATIPPKMMIETPLPMPSSVMICPNQMANMVPAVSEARITAVCSGYVVMPNSEMTAPACVAPGRARMAVCP